MRRIRHGAQQPLWRDGKPSSRAIPANSGLAADHRERLSQRYSEWDLHFLSAIEGGQLVVEYATVCFRSQEDCGPLEKSSTTPAERLKSRLACPTNVYFGQQWSRMTLGSNV